MAFLGHRIADKRVLSRVTPFFPRHGGMRSPRGMEYLQYEQMPGIVRLLGIER
jgi:hypothetical protein